jgi:hypothetical protein
MANNTLKKVDDNIIGTIANLALNTGKNRNHGMPRG